MAKKLIPTAIAIAKLHNFCVDVSDISDDKPLVLATDGNYIMNNHNGYVELIDDYDHNTTVPSDLMHGGCHFDDFPWNVQAEYKYDLDQC